MSAAAILMNERRPGNPHKNRVARVGSELAASARAMEDDLLDVNCGRCGRPLVMRIEDLRDRRTVECTECAQRIEDGADALAWTEETPSPRLRLLPSTPQRRDPC